jgi:hypothetical protein
MPIEVGSVPGGTRESTASRGSVTVKGAAAAIAGLVLISGCAQATRHAGAPAGRARYTDIEVNAIVVNAGSNRGYTVFQRRSVDITVQPDSSARTVLTQVSPPGFENAHERLKWIDAGKPQFPPTAAAGVKTSLPAGNFSFLPFPPLLSFRRAAALAPSPGRIMTVIMGSSRPSAASERAFYAAMQLGTLLAVAPLHTAARRAAWNALISLANIRDCSGGADGAGRTGTWMCVNSTPDELKILTNTRDQRVLSVEELLIAPSLRYPGVSVGSVIESSTYIIP